MSLSKAKQDLEHHVWKLIKHHSLQDKKFLVALSGGVDSVALLCVLSKIHKKESIGACYFHHGEDSNQEYRNGALVFCENLCKQMNVRFYPVRSTEVSSSVFSSDEIAKSKSKVNANAKVSGVIESPIRLKTPGESLTKLSSKSEEFYRELRYAALSRVMKTEKFDLLSTAHHRDDLLETRMLRLIRGSGAQGIQAMHILKERMFRPFLEITKDELKTYLREEKVQAFEDPSNDTLDPLRNWLRQKWFKDLETRSPGGLSALARSLETIAQELESRPWGELLACNESYESQGLSRSFYLSLSLFEQKRLLAQYLYSLGKRDFSQAHLEEIQKRLDKSQKVITFKVGGCHWEVNAGQIKVQS